MIKRDILCYLPDGNRLVRVLGAITPVFQIIVVKDKNWQVACESDDFGHVANMLVKAGYQSEHATAIRYLNSR